jgi:hypothetical protein
MTGVPPSGSGLRPFGAEPQDASQAKPLVPNAAVTPGEWLPAMLNTRTLNVVPHKPHGFKAQVVTSKRMVAHAFGADEAETAANARLIATAPELYALLAILEWGDDEGCPFCGMGKESGHLDRCQLNDALSSVRGEQ